MLINISVVEAEKILERSIINFPYNKFVLHWTDYEDTNLIVNLLKGCRAILELGTYKGHTTQNIASICDPEYLITVDIVKESGYLPPNIQAHELLSESESGMMINHPSVSKIHLTTDEFFETNCANFDGIFIDAAHNYDNVVKDIENAKKILNPGGIIVCHDVYNQDRACSKALAEPNNPDVVDALFDDKAIFYKVGRSWVAFMISSK